MTASDSRKKSLDSVKKAYRHVRRREFSEAILILEIELASGLGNIYLLFLLAICYLFTDQFGKAARFIQVIKQKNQRYLPMVQLESFLMMKSSADKEAALKHYSNALLLYPSDSHLLRAREELRNCPDFARLQKQALLGDYVSVPAPDKGIPHSGSSHFTGVLDRGRIRIDRGGAKKKIIIGVSAAAAAIAAAVYMSTDLIRLPSIRTADEHEITDIASINSRDPINWKNTGDISYFYENSREIEKDFVTAKGMLKLKKYNGAVMLLNRIINSNAGFSVRDRASFLVKHISGADDLEYETPGPDLSNNKWMYQGCGLRVRGKAVKTTKKRGSIEIVMKILDAAGSSLLCEADVFMDKPLEGIAAGQCVEVCGVVTDVIGKNDRLYITARSIRRLEKKLCAGRV